MASNKAEEIVNSQSITAGLLNIERYLEQWSSDGLSVNLVVSGQQECASRLQSKAESLVAQLKSQIELIGGLCQRAERARQERLQADEEYAKLLDEKIRLMEEERFVRSNREIQEIEQKKDNNLEFQALETERNLLEFARQDLARKKEDIQILESRLEEKRMLYEQEWEGFKDDIRRAREEKRPYITKLQEVDNIALSRFKGMLRFMPLDFNEEERLRVERIIQELEINKELDEEKEKFLDFEIMSRDLKHAENYKRLERRSLWQQFDSLEHEKRLQNMSDEEVGSMLRGVPNMVNLLASPMELVENLADDSGDDEFTAVVGKELHRVHKNTDISVTLSEEEKRAFKAMLYDGEESTDDEGECAIVGNDQQSIDPTPKLDVERKIQPDKQEELKQSSEDRLAGGNQIPTEMKDMPKNVPEQAEASASKEPKQSSEEKIPNVNKKPALLKDIPKNVLEQSEGSDINPTGLISKIRGRMGMKVDPATGQPIKLSGSGMAFPIQRHVSDPRYKVDAKFLEKRGRR